MWAGSPSKKAFVGPEEFYVAGAPGHFDAAHQSEGHLLYPGGRLPLEDGAKVMGSALTRVPFRTGLTSFGGPVRFSGK